ncbi:ATP-binding cassette domain-containing protein [Streptomyces bohaiensis]|uniref:UvrABC system protein A n=1 Tax=Streptomyces bohaiensis TaxID=1431344 RepID=A0ABX1C2Y8_9ACTN|nr:excinuclease ABC subunit UvrA [Streptomyces bohaiensis]NJQ13607.1 excinuclease ABC subunit UvrA [Streptomyces bohaiensis]
MSTDGEINVVRARENNLREVSLRIPKRGITVFTGVSGSGKSSLAFDTIAAEAQRQLNETFTAFQRGFLPQHGRPDADALENLSAAIVVDQKRLGGNSRSTVGTITDIAPLLRLLLSRGGAPHHGAAHAYSFNDPLGMCPACEGIGRTTEIDLDALVDRSLSLNGGAIQHPDFGVGKWFWDSLAGSGLFDNDKPLCEWTEAEWRTLLHGGDALGPTPKGYEGLLDRFTRVYVRKDTAEMAERNRKVFLRFVTSATCGRCDGSRYNDGVLASRIGGHSIADLSALEATELLALLPSLAAPDTEPVVASLVDRVGDLVAIGLGYLSLDRRTTTLSGGESQRIKMVRHLSSSLTDMLYVFDEPSIGLHARDVHRLNALLRKLRDKGNTVLVVEHDPDVIAIADHVVDMGPRAGEHGGQVVHQGTPQTLAAADTVTGRELRRRAPVRQTFRTPTGRLEIRAAARHNLRDVTVAVPTGVVTAVTGVAGSGKSTLVGAFLEQHPEAVVVDQSAVGTNRRSSPVTYTGMLDGIRRLFARAGGVSASLFSFNSTGACPGCQGMGVVWTDLAFMDGVRTPCEECGGRRFREEVRQHTLRGRSIDQVLAMTAREAAEFFTERALHAAARAMVDVGLDYLRLGQPLSTLSGGECQRLKLATVLHGEGSVYVLDEPTTGLHMADVDRLLGIVDRLVAAGNTVLLIEHNLEVIKQADWIVDLGPEGGSRGGRVLFEGTPRALLDCAESHTAAFLRREAAAAR